MGGLPNTSELLGYSIKSIFKDMYRFEFRLFLLTRRLKSTFISMIYPKLERGFLDLFFSQRN